MTYFKQINRTFLPFLLLLCWAGCKDDLVIDNSDQQFPLALNVIAGNDKVTLQWDAANVSNFEKYVIVRSRNPIPVGIRPTFSTPDFEIILQTDDVKITSFVDELIPIVDKIYYKLYIGFGDRFVESDATAIPFDNLLIDGNSSVIHFIPDSNWVLLGDEFTGILRLVNYTTKEVKAQRSVPFTNSDNMCFDVVVENGKQVLYWWGGYNNFFKYSLPELTQLNFWPVTFSGFSLLLGNDNQVFTTQYDYNESFTLRRLSDMSVLRGHNRTDYYAHRTLLMLDRNTNLIVEASPYRILIYNVNGITGEVSNLIENSFNSSNVFTRNIPVSKNGQYFVPRYDGIVYDRNLNPVVSIPFQNNGLADVAFSADEQFIYVAYKDFSFGTSLIQKYTFPSMEVVGTRQLTGVSPRSIKVVSDGLLFVGNTLNGPNQILVKKIDL